MLSKLILVIFLVTTTTGYKLRHSRKNPIRNKIDPKTFKHDDVSPAEDEDEDASKPRSFKGAVVAVQAAARISNKEVPQGRFDKFKMEAGDIDKTEFIAGAAEGTIGGLMKVIEGIQSGSWVEIATGSLDMITSVVGMLGPKGAVIGAVLSLISSLIGIFGGSTGDEESQEQMLERIVKTALDDARSEELKAEVNGAKEFLSTLSDTINIFREKDNVTYEQALAFYELSFEGVRIFGVLEHYINSWCAVGNVEASNLKVKDPTTKRCLSVCKLYCDLSIYRQILLADMAGVISKAGHDATAIVFLEMINKEKKKDMKILEFFEEPFIYKDQRYVIAQFYSKKSDYPTIAVYLKEIMKPKHAEDSKSHQSAIAMECDLWELQGSCRQIILETKRFREYPYCKKFLFRTESSVYIPSGFKLERPYMSGFKDRYYGPSVYGMKIDKLAPNLCFDKTDAAANDRVRVCEATRMSLAGRCASMELRSYNEDELKSIGWFNKIQSVYVPKGIAFTGNFKGGSNTYYGPATYMLVAKPNAYSSLTIAKSELKTSEMVQLCTETNLNGNCFYHDFTLEKKYRMTDLQQINPTFNQIKSLKVPSKRTVTMFGSFEGEEMTIGKYMGPFTVADTEFKNSGIKVDVSEDRLYDSFL